MRTKAPPLLVCSDRLHEQLPPRQATYGTAALTHWACPYCTYHVTTITAAEEPDMHEITDQDRLSVITAYSEGKTDSQVEAAHKHLTPTQIFHIAQDHGHPSQQKMRWAIGRLTAKLQRDGKAMPSGDGKAMPSGDGSSGGHRSLDELVQIAATSPRKGTRLIGTRLQDLGAKLAGVLRDEQQKTAERERAETDRAAAAAQVKQLQEQLAAAKAKLHPGKKPGKPAAEESSSGPSSASIRAWAKAAGVDCPDRGVLPQRVRDAYAAAHQQVRAS